MVLFYGFFMVTGKILMVWVPTTTLRSSLSLGRLTYINNAYCNAINSYHKGRHCGITSLCGLDRVNRKATAVMRDEGAALMLP